jgi:hypothetical protein
MKQKNPRMMGLKQLVRTYPLINIRGHRDPHAPPWSDPFIFQVEGHTETRAGKMVERGEMEVPGQVHGGSADETRTVEPGIGMGSPYETYTKGYRPTHGFWFLMAREDILRGVVEALPDDAEVSIEVYLDAGTHCNLVKHRLHADHLYLCASWQRGTKRYERRFMLDSQVTYHNSNRFGEGK